MTRDWHNSVLKSFSWKMIGGVTLFLVTYALGASIEQTSKIAITYHLVTFFLYIFHERAWERAKSSMEPPK